MTTNLIDLTSTVKSKSVLRKRLEEIHSEIQMSWLRDQDKVKELIELCGILEQIHNKSAIEDFFENQEDFNFFCGKFSKDTIENILKQHYVYGTNGDEVAMNLLFLYMRIFYKFMEKPQYQTLWESVKEILEWNKPYYRGISGGINKVINQKKLLSADRYNETMLVRKADAKFEISGGLEIDVLIDTRKGVNTIYDRREWVRGIVNKVESDHFLVNVADEERPLIFRQNSFDYAPKGTMTKDWEWRQNISQYEMVDCLDRGRWFPSTVLHRREEEINGLKKVDYRIGFRLYTHLAKNWEEYRRFWKDKDSLLKDSVGEYFGDQDNIDEWISSHSRRIQQFGKFISSSEISDSFENENYFIDDAVNFINGNKKTYIIARNTGFSYYFALVLNYFCEIGGFDKMISLLSQKGDDKASSDLIGNIFAVLASASGFIHKEFIIQLGKNLHDNIFTYLNELSQNELRSMKKETFDLIIKVLRFYIGLSVGAEERNQIVEKFSINFAVKMIKTTFLEKRITAVKTIVDVIKASKNNEEKKISVLKLIEENKIFYEIYGPNSHTQLYNKSKELLEIMLLEDKLSDGEMEMIWGATKKGDLEGKLNILKTLKEISSSMQPKHINMLLDQIYSSGSNDLLNDEIDLIYSLSTHKSQSEETLDRCIKFFTGCLLESKNDEGERIEILINKIYEITKLNPSFKTSVINMTLDSLEKNENVNLALKILTTYLKDPNLDQDFDLTRHLLDNDHLVTLFCSNFYKYMANIRERAKNWTQDIDLLPMRDNFNHSQNVKARLQFLNTLLSLKLWRIKEDPIEFVYSSLIKEAISVKDRNEFFNWIKHSIDSNVDYETEEKIFQLFNQRICNDTKACQNLSIEAFDTYLRVFLDLNQMNKNLNYKRVARENKFDLEVFVEPEKLIGFNILWRIVFESFSVDIMNKGIETLHSLFTSVQIISENPDSVTVSYSELLLKKCLSLINETIAGSSSAEEKKNIITKCLFVLKLMIEESEKRGTARISSHSGILKKRIITVKIASSVGAEKNFSLRLYGNTTVWELKELISAKLKYSFDFLRIYIVKSEYELKATDNGKTMIDLGVETGDEVKCIANGLEKQIQNVDLVADNQPVKELVDVLYGWHETYSKDGKMSKEDCSKFIKAVTAFHGEVTAEDDRISFLFNTYNKAKDSNLLKEEFAQFFIDCALKEDKRKTVWENLKTMGVRNDLKKMNDPFLTYNEDRTILPRYQLAHNEDFFNTVFYLQDLNDEIAKEAFSFLCLICTNPSVYNQNLNVNENTVWASLLPESNIYKLIYSLQIIESFIEDIEINDTHVDSLKNKEESQDSKFEWMKNFVEKGGYAHLINILQKKLVDYVTHLAKKETIQNQLMTNICIDFLIKIVKIFYFSSLSKFDSYKKTIQEITKKLSVLDLNETTETSPGYTKKPSVQVDLNALDSYFIDSGLGDYILKSFDQQSLIENLLHLIVNLVDKPNRSREEAAIINTSFEFMNVIIPFSDNYEAAENFILANKHFISISLYGLINNSNTERVVFSNSLIKLIKLLQFSERYELISYMFFGIFELIENISKELEGNSNELFEFFSYLLDIYLGDPLKFNTSNFKTEIDPKKFLKKLLDNLELDINSQDTDSEINLSNELFVGYLKIITKVAENNPKIRSEISDNYNLIQGVLTKVLFKQNLDELSEKFSKIDLVNPDKINDNKSTRNSNPVIRGVCYNFILSMLKNSIENFEKFFSINVLESGDSKKAEEKESKNVYSRNYICNYGKSEGHVGLRNLHFICYMNSMVQQFFMVPALRYNILKADDKREPELENPLKIDDNTLHQVQRMFSFLELSQRMDYNPVGFCYSFKDWEGNPTNVGVQQDAQEFLTRFLDIVESSLSSTKYKYLLQSIFGGKTCSQFICEGGCGTVTNRYEDFCTLSLEVKNMKTINDSLEKLIAPERLDEVNCESCARKVSKTRRSLLGALPNVLIVHLQRLSYNYEIDRNEKVNSRLEFPKVLNLKDYTVEEITRKSTAKKSDDENFETDDVYNRHPSYYEYHLVGVVIHSGTADAGHYYSYINTVRSGSENESHFNPNEEAHVNAWLEFNDSHVSKFNVANLEGESFGGVFEQKEWGSTKGERSRSAYMLVYERILKSPIKIVVEPNENSAKLISFKQDEASKVKKEFDLHRVFGTPDYNQIQNKLFNSTFYDVAKNEYIAYIPYYSKERKVPKSYYLELAEDNSQLQKHQNISDNHFITFFDKIIELLDQTMINTKEIKLESSTKISTTFMNFIFNILCQKDKQSLLNTAKDKFLHIIEAQPICLVPVWKYIGENLKIVNDLLINDSEMLSSEYCDLILDLIKRAYATSPEKLIEALNSDKLSILEDDDMFTVIKKIIEGILAQFPRIPSKLVGKTGAVMKLLKNFAEINDKLFEYLANKEIVFIFITYFLGRDSPYYEDTLVKKGENWDFGRSALKDFEPVVQLIYDIFSKSSNNKFLTSTSSITMSQRDIECLKNTSFLKFIFKNCATVFSSLIVNLNYEDEDFTIASCLELTKYVNDFYSYNGHDFLSLIRSIIPLISMKDSLQRCRLEIILGVPQLQVSEVAGKNVFPLIGFHNLGDERAKLFDTRGTLNLRNTCSVIKKIMMLKSSKEHFIILSVLALLEACTQSMEVLKYLKSLKAEEPLFEDFLDWSITLVSSSKKDCNQTLETLLNTIKENLAKIDNDKSILPGFKGFAGRYLLNDIKREEISLLTVKDNVYLFGIDYLTNTIPLDKNIDYSKSRAFVNIGNMSLFSGEEKLKVQHEVKSIVDEENLTEIPETVQLISSETKTGMTEREFFNKIIANFTVYKKVIVENRLSVPNARQTFKRFTVFNDSTKDINIELKIKRQSTPHDEDVNEYIPSGYILAFIPSKTVKTVYLMPKIDPDKDWESSANWETLFEYQVVTVRTGGGNYSGVSNSGPVHINYTPHAIYSNPAVNAGYPQISSGYEMNKIDEEYDDAI